MMLGCSVRGSHRRQRQGCGRRQNNCRSHAVLSMVGQGDQNGPCRVPVGWM
jgi:hypothetical protein